MGGTIDDSTNVMIVNLKAGASFPSTINANLLERLRKSSLSDNPRIVALIRDYPDYGNRLLSLFRVLKEFEIEVSDNLEELIKKDISKTGMVVNLLGIMKQIDMDPKSLPIELIFKAAQFDSVVGQSINNLKMADLLDLPTLELLFSYPQHALELSQLLINLQECAFDTSILVDKLTATPVAGYQLKTILDLLGLILEKNIYYPAIVDILLRQEKYIEKIAEGARKLAAENLLLSNYFELLEQNPQNANVFAKNIILLNNASLIDHHDFGSLVKVSKLGVGAFHFMRLLQIADLLTEKNYQKICAHNDLLSRADIIESLGQLPMIATFNKDELERMLEIMINSPLPVADVLAFRSILANHLICEEQVSRTRLNA
ncbi:hypothetical protein OQJ18_09325 [Fluoribacter dumoffii]|uniref:Uncharacterized protein n=1 Tax=Fluoribacter dumoffii TaxID=463 RepID=A0A377G7C6_9GAMM|nr:hypothetical protein [Fluoribacter dumoffii]KTC89440.1 hypothetical protein Ldum_0508 [Fluoribacter dumoffii NY 23]MCW8386764.1 hypothetical protein [Fluoribacter dumoffii]MCW8417701.1 hypothetical protein [Fluoribacter dumoffii]MCW8454457.1 hypothetical protein [Fluoribacter dumoffii]MCW8461469.1 hypothetical protein [Fluoribacter dumoffii]